MPFWHTMDPGEVYDPPRRKWDEFGPDEQERNLRLGIGAALFDYLEEKEDGRDGSDDRA